MDRKLDSSNSSLIGSLIGVQLPFPRRFAAIYDNQCLPLVGFLDDSVLSKGFERCWV